MSTETRIIKEFMAVVNKWRVEPDQLSIMRRLYSPEVIDLLRRAQEAIQEASPEEAVCTCRRIPEGGEEFTDLNCAVHRPIWEFPCRDASWFERSENRE